MAKDRQPHIGIFGRRNYGKSTLINLLAGQEVAIVSDIAGTTTDPVKKSFEITGFGPVVLIDTAARICRLRNIFLYRFYNRINIRFLIKDD